MISKYLAILFGSLFLEYQLLSLHIYVPYNNTTTNDSRFSVTMAYLERVYMYLHLHANVGNEYRQLWTNF